MRFLVLLSLLVTAISCAFAPPQTWENTRYDRSINLGKSYVKEHLQIQIKNIDSKPNDEYYLALPSYIFEKLVVFSLIDADSLASTPVVLKSQILEETTEVNGEPIINYLKVILPHPIAPKQTFNLGVSLSISNLLEPLPSKIGIADDQTLLLKTYKEPLSAYPTVEGQLSLLGVQAGKEVAVQGKEIEIPGKVVNKQVQYDFGSTKAFRLTSLTFVYTHNFPLTQITSLEKGVWVSHWANTLQFEEFYKMTNKAAQLKDGFARVDFMLNQKKLSKSSHSINAVEIRLLDDSRDIYYTDLVGNVSTSKGFSDRVYIKPRYPVFGGWNYNFTIGWTNTLSRYLRQDDSEDYILKVPILTGPVDASYDKLELSFYLPEGAKVKDIYSPIPYESITYGNELSYFDLNTGHTKATITYTNLIDELNQYEIIIKYEYTAWDFIRKPLDIAKFVFIALISYLLISKIDISLKAKK